MINLFELCELFSGRGSDESPALSLFQEDLTALTRPTAGSSPKTRFEKLLRVFAQ
jgi:hypothetical protein